MDFDLWKNNGRHMGTPPLLWVWIFKSSFKQNRNVLDMWRRLNTCRPTPETALKINLL
jgi:hypothetical protein